MYVDRLGRQIFNQFYRKKYKFSLPLFSHWSNLITPFGGVQVYVQHNIHVIRLSVYLFLCVSDVQPYRAKVQSLGLAELLSGRINEV